MAGKSRKQCGDVPAMEMVGGRRPWKSHRSSCFRCEKRKIGEVTAGKCGKVSVESWELMYLMLQNNPIFSLGARRTVRCLDDGECTMIP